MTGSGPRKSPSKLCFISKLAIATLVAGVGAGVLFASGAGGDEPMLVGAVGPEQVLKISPDWKMMHDAYAPAPAAVEGIRKAAATAKGDLRIEVVFGSWCEDSLNQVPPFIRILEQVGKDLLPAAYLGVDRSKKDPEGKSAGWRIERVPTFIVTRKGAEIGRIVETPKATLEADLAEILSPHAPQ